MAMTQQEFENDILSVRCIDSEAIESLADEGVTTIAELSSKYFSYGGDKFCDWLLTIGVSSPVMVLSFVTENARAGS